MTTAQEVFDEAFKRHRGKRSEAYKLGCLDCLQVRLDGRENVRCPFPEGSAESDAYFAGVGEGCALSPKKMDSLSISNVPAAMVLPEN